MTRVLGIIALLIALLPSAAVAEDAPLDDTDASFVVNLRDAEISLLAEQISEITDRTLVIDPNLTGNVTVISAKKLTKAGVWSLFQSMLRVRGYVAVESGALWEIIPEAESVARGGAVPPDGRAGDQDVVTELVPLARLPSTEAVRVLKPLVADTGYIESLTDPNAIIITDTQANVDRIVTIARTFDRPEREDRTEVIRFTFADATAVAKAMNDVLGTSGTGARISVDAASNVLLVRGTERDISRIRQLARDLDVAPRRNPRVRKRTHIYALKFGDAETVAKIVSNTLQDGTDIVSTEGDDGDAPVPPRPAPKVSVEASTETNSIVIRGTENQIIEANSLIAALDQRPRQVMIEAAIVEVSGDVAERLGTQFGIGPDVPSGGIAATSFANGGNSLASVLDALGVNQAATLAGGLTLGVGVDGFGILVQALSQSTQANLLSTPSITTTDNKAATIVVGQNVPFRTGEFATDGNTATPFTTIERRDVGITMQVLPRVTANGIVRLDISQEVSSLVNANVDGAADLITNRRVIDTTVQARDGGTVVLGGLITDDTRSTLGKVPGLGDAPIIGGLFRSRSKEKTRRTLFVFMRPTVIDSQDKARAVAQRQYNRLRKADAAEPPRNLLKERKVKRLPLEINGLY